MKIKNKGKVHPTPSSSSSSSSSNDRELVLSVLKLLPAAILALASVLSLEDREVLAYMITRSLKTPSSSSSSLSSESKKKSSKKAQNTSNNGGGHKPPMFGCDCFDCYTSYWVRWDASPNRELIHQVIEAFEDRLTNGEESSSKKINGRGKRRDKLGRAARQAPNLVVPPAQPDSPLPESSSSSSTAAAAADASSETTYCGENAVVSVSQAEKSADEGNERKENDVVEGEEISEVADDDVAVVLRTMAASDYKGLAREVLPDVLGLLFSRLWSLWSPNA